MKTKTIRRHLLRLVSHFELADDRLEWEGIVRAQCQQAQDGIINPDMLESLEDVIEELVTR